MNRIDPIIRDTNAYHNQLARDDMHREALTQKLTHSEGDVIEALREATWGSAPALRKLFLAYAKGSDDAVLGSAVRHLIDDELLTAVDSLMEDE